MKLNAVMAGKGLAGDYAAVAQAFGVATPSVYGWIDNGRISKDRLQEIAAWSGRTLDWWLSAEANPRALQEPGAEWKLQAQQEGLRVVELLATAVRNRTISDNDWALLGQIAERFAAASNSTQAMGAPIAPEHQAAMDRLAEEAEDHHQQSQQRRRTARR